jgi:hypothetical protein
MPSSTSSRHLLVAYSWSINNIGDIGITPGLLNLVHNTSPGTRAVVLTSQSATDPAVAWLRTYFPRYLPDCAIVPNPFRQRLGTHTDPGTPGSAWHSFHQRWAPARLRAFQNGTVAAADAAAIAADMLDRLPRELFDIDRVTAPELLAAALGIHRSLDAARARVTAVMPELEHLARQVLVEVRRHWREK